MTNLILKLIGIETINSYLLGLIYGIGILCIIKTIAVFTGAHYAKVFTATYRHECSRWNRFFSFIHNLLALVTKLVYGFILITAILFVVDSLGLL